MLPGPVFVTELLTTARRPRYFVIRLIYGIILLFFIWQNDPGSGIWGRGVDMADLSINEIARLGEALFATFLTVQSVAVLLLTPALVAGVIADERQRKTLHYLLASRLSSAEIILGKLLARMLHLGIFIAIGLPIMSLLTLFGGVDPGIVILAFATTLTTAFFLSALSILVSTHARRPREAITFVYVLEFCWLFVPSLAAMLLRLGGPRWATFSSWIRLVLDWVAPTSPLYNFGTIALTAGSDLSVLLHTFAWMMGLQVTYGVLFVVIALLQLRRVNRNDGGGRVAARFAGLRRGRRLMPRPECGDDAMLWKECFVSRTSLVVKIATIAVSVVMICGLAYFTYGFARPAFTELVAYGYGTHGVESARDEFNGFLRFVCTLTYVLIGMAIATGASSGFTSEREEDTWISLVSTPLEGPEIVRAKLLGAIWGQKWALVVLVLLWGLGLAAGALHPLGFIAVALETTVFLWFTAALGTYYSLLAKSSARALLATMATLILLNGGYLMCCIPMRPNSLVFVAGVTPALVGVSLISYGDLQGFSSGMTSSGVGEVVFAVFVGVGAYGLGAGMLTAFANVRFDEEAGRAQRYGQRLPPKLITYLDDASVEPADGEASGTNTSA